MFPAMGLVLAMTGGPAFGAEAETVDVVNPKGTVLLENAEVLTDDEGDAYVDLGNGYHLYAGPDEILGSYDDLVMGFGSYPQSDVTGEVSDPLNWRILDIQDGVATLMCQYSINAVFFNVDETDGIDWETSNVRAWLNSTGGVSFTGDTDGFYDVAFTDEEKEKIKLSDVRMDYSDWPLWDASVDEYEYDGAEGTYPVYDKMKEKLTGLTYPWNLYTTTGTDTQDYVYLLSGEEVFYYFGDPDETLLADNEWNHINYTNAYFTCSDYALAQGAKYNGGTQEAFFYNADSWLRSPGIITEDGTCYGVFLGTNGDIDAGREVNNVQESQDDGHEITYGVIPVIQVSLES